MRILKLAGILLALVIGLAFPMVFTNPAVTTIAVFALIFAAATTGWNIFSGYTGYIALGHAAYFGLGAYALAIMCQDWNIPGGYQPFWFVPLAGLVAAIFAIPLGWVALRVRRHSFVVITIAIFFILQLLAYNLRNLTNGSTGLGLPIPFNWGGDFYNIPFYYASLILLVLAVVISWYVRNSKYGLGLLAIRDDEDRALSLGVKTGSSKLVAFVISAFIVGMAGAIWAYFVESISPPSVFDATFDVSFALMAFMGGLGTITGPILGALLLESAQQYLTLQSGDLNLYFIDLNFQSSSSYLIIFGALFLVVILLLPRGIVPTINDRWNKYRAMRNQQRQPGNSAVNPAPLTGNGAATTAEKKEGINL